VILFFVLEKGIRGWNFSVVSPGNESWIEGYNFYYGVSIRTILILTTFILSIPEIARFIKKSNSKFLNNNLWIINVLLLLTIISTVLSSDYVLSFFGLLRIIQSLLLLLVSLIFVQKKKNIDYLFLSIFSLAIYTGFVGILQNINQGPLGWFLEEATYLGSGFFTSDGERLYRASGLFGHPTFYASFMSILLPVLIGYLLKNYKQSQTKIFFYVIGIISLVLGTILTYSRSSWFSSIFVVSLMFVMYFKKNNFIYYKYKKTIISILSILLLIPIIIKTVGNRIISSLEFISDGSGAVRIDLIRQSMISISKFPLFGSGLNLSPRLMVSQSLLEPNLLGFIYPVHNTFILFFVEIGVIAGLIFIYLIIYNLVKSFKYVKFNFISLGIWLGIVAFILNAQVHTLFSQDPSYDLLFLLLGMNLGLCQKKI